jgi:hypothetical protein
MSAAEVKPDTSYIVIKGRFKALNTSSYGLFIVFLDNITKNVERYDVISSHFSTLFENNIGMPWNELDEIITKLKWKGEYATSLTHDIQASIEDLFQPGTGRTQDIWANIKKAQVGKVVTIFEEVLGRPTGDKNIKCEVAIETVTKSEIEDVKRARREREGKDTIGGTSGAPAVNQQEQANREAGIEENAVILEVSLVLSPVSGVAIADLKDGDKIMVKISEQSSRGQYFIDLLNATKDNEIIPIPATVVRTNKEAKIYIVLANIGPGVYGKSLDEDNVKVKMYDPTTDKRKPSEIAATAQAAKPTPQTGDNSQENGEKKKKSMNWLFIIIGVAALLMILILIYLFGMP